MGKWEEKKIEDIFKIKSGGFISKKDFVSSDGYEVYGGNGRTGLFSDFNLDGEQIIIGRVGAKCGNVRLVNKKIWLTDNAFYISDYSVEINKKFLKIFLEFTNLGSTANQSAQPVISYKGIKDLKIPLPPIATQKQIVSKLDALFARIDKSIALLEENIQHTKDLMASVLDGEFNSINNDELIIKKLGEVTTKIGSGSTPRGGQKSYKTEGVSLIRSMNVHDMFFKKKNLAFIDDAQAEKLKSVIIEKNDVLLNITGASVARCCIVDKSYLPARVNQHVAIIRLNQEFLSEFVMYYLVSPKVKYGLLNSSSGNATREALTKTMIENIEIPYITKEKQTKMVIRIKKGFEIEKKLITQQSEKLSHLQSLKSSLLDMAFKGELV